MRGSARLILLGLAVLAALGIFRVIQIRADQKYERELSAVRSMMEQRRYATARRTLQVLSTSRPDSDEANYLLGLCEKALGRFDEAVSAWEGVPLQSPFRARAVAEIADEWVNTGRYSDAERLILEAAGDDAGGSYSLARALIRLYRFEGRNAEVRRLLRQALARSPDPASDLKELWLLDNSPMPVEALELALTRADPRDDRVWLARANLDILTGRFGEARRWLDRCLELRPGDPAVWRTRLDLGLASSDLNGTKEALAHVPASMFTERERSEIRARLAELRQDRVAESKAWLELLEREPGHPRALERLATLRAMDGRLEDAADFQARKARFDRAKDGFRKRLLDGNLEAQAGELARIAHQLGNSYEAAAWNALERYGSDRWKLAAPELDRLTDARVMPVDGPSLADVWGIGAAPEASGQFTSNRPDHAIAAPVFVEAAHQSGLDFIFDHGATPNRLLPETMSGGLALLDYDGDNSLDVFVVQGGPLDDGPAIRREPDRLFRNRADGTFEDVTERSGIASLPRGYGLGVTTGDFDNDGHVDLFLTRLRSYALWRNRGDGTFEDVTELAGLSGTRDNPTSAAFADLDRDGDLDLYVCHYMIYDPAHPIQCRNDKGEFFYCDPSRVEAAQDRLFRNDGGRFVDVTELAGIIDREGRGLGVVAADFDDDGLTDLYVANDGTANYLFRNLGDLRFEETALSTGAAGSGEGGYQASMGIACGDADEDGRLDLIVTNFYGEGSTLYHNLGQGLFTDSTGPSGVGLATRYLLGFGTSFLDYDRDGHLDLVTANGHVNDNRPYYPNEMPAQLLAGLGDGRFADVSRSAGPPWDRLLLGRGLVVGDLDNDADPDVLILPQGQPLVYLRNETPGGRSLTLALEGSGSNRDGVGARVVVKAGQRAWMAERFGGGSYQSAGDPRILLGVGDAEQVDRVEVRWPSGQLDRFEELPTNGFYRLQEGDPVASRIDVPRVDRRADR